MKVAYKWMVSGNTYAYITQPSLDSYYIGTSLSSSEDEMVAIKAKTMTEDKYKANFAAMSSELESKYGVKMLDYTIYYNLSVDECASLVGPVGPTGPKGEQGPIGLRGPTGLSGNTGAEGPTGPPGPKGEQGNGLNIKGSLPSESNLPGSGQSGDAYIINGNLYVWVGSGGTTSDGKWANTGKIQGEDGPTGPPGPKGDTGAQGPKGEQGAKGSTGAVGPTGPTGPPGPSGGAASSIEITKNDKKTFLGGIVDSGATAMTQMNILTSITASDSSGLSSQIGFFQTSDIRLKDIIGTAEFDIDKVLNLSIIYFKYKNDKDAKIHLGLIAQELKEICPAIVSENENGYLEIEYDKISLILLFMIKSLYNKIKGE